ncbi:protoporphyrinogen oxidase [Oceanithermus sp.]
MKRVVVVGGGLAGLAAAYEAKRRGAAVTLLEKDRPGGKVRTIRDDGFVIETGPDAVVRYKPWALALARELGLEDEVVGTLPARPAAYIRVRGRNHPLPEGLNVVIPSRLGPLVRTSLFSPLGKLRAGLDLFLPRGPEGDEAFGAFIRRRLGREVWENLAAPLTGGIYGGDPENLSLLAAFPMLKELEKKHRSLILGSLAAMKKRRASREGGSLFASFEGGQARLVEALLDQLDGSLHAGERALAIEQEGSGWRVTGERGVYPAELLVLAVPAPAAAELLEPLGFPALAELRSIPYHSAATVTMAFDAAGFPERNGHGVLFARPEGFGARGFTWLDRKWAHRAPEGYALCRAYFSGEEAEQDEEELLKTALRDLRRLLGASVEPERVWIERFPRGMPAYTVGHLKRLAAIEAAEKGFAGLALVGAAYRGVGIPEVIRDGRRAVSEFLEEHPAS